MAVDEKQKICIECRSLVSHDAQTCPACGYPFDNTRTVKCGACNSVITADVEVCPVCGQKQEPLSRAGSETAPAECGVVAADTVPRAATVDGGISAVGDHTATLRKLDEISMVVQRLATAVERRGGDAVQGAHVPPEAVNAMQRACETMLAESRQTAEILRTLEGVKAAIADVAARQAAGTDMVVGTLKAQNGAGGSEEGAPARFKWLDYMFAAIVVSLIFSMLNLLVMAYVARLVLSTR